MASITDVARVAGVTAGVVSRLLNDDPALRIRPETRERVLAAARELEYTPNHAARALRRARVGVLGLAVHDISNPVYGAVIEGAQTTASERGHVLLLADVMELARDNEAFARVIRSGAIDGLLLMRAGNERDRMVARISSARVPTVLINDRSRTLGSVALDDRAAARLATSHLLELGHRRVALLRLDGRFARSADRVRGWKDACVAHGLETPAEYVVGGGHTAAAGGVGMRALLELERRPTAVVASSVLSAMGAVAAIRAAGLEVPRDISVVGYHDVFFTEHLAPPLTVVKLALREMGAVAVTTLLDQLDGAPARHVVVTEPEPELVLRASTAPPSSDRSS